MPAESLSAAEARRVAIAAQGIGRRSLDRPPGIRQVVGLARQLGVIQIDSVNVLARAHYLPLFARLGPYEQTLLDRAAYKDRRLFESWAHEASFVPVELWPLLQWKAERDLKRWGERVTGNAATRAYMESVFDEVVARGPLAASELSDPGERGGSWWGWAAGKRALEWLFRIGRLAVATRRNFERVYDLPERVLPAAILSAPVPDSATAQRTLLVIAARALGVASLNDLADYFRQQINVVKPIVLDMVASGELRSVAVEGWPQLGYVPASRLEVPGTASMDGVRALLSPFDALVWDRKRVERLFDFVYRIEIYVPAPKRVYGYYVLPFLMDDRLVARVDLKADRKARALLVQGAFAEEGTNVGDVAGALADELELMASWLGLDAVTVGERGNGLARPLRKAVGATAGR